MTDLLSSRLPRPARRLTERQALLRRFADLSYEDRLWATAAIARLMQVASKPPTAFEQEVADRRASLAAYAAAARHLGREPLSVEEYDRSRGELGLAWSSAKMIRLWGKWRFVVATASGDRPAKTVAERLARRRLGLGRREEPLVALGMWLRSAPATDRAADYDAWARDVNLNLEPGQIPLPRQRAIVNGLALSWHDALAVARGEESSEEAVARTYDGRDWSRGQHDLISVGTIALMRGVSVLRAFSLTVGFDFPPAALVLSGRRAWLRDDVVAFFEDARPPRRLENELGAIYCGVEEYAQLIGMSKKSHPPLVDVEPMGRVANCRYWLRAEVEAWAASNESRVIRRREATKRPGTTDLPGSDTFISMRGLERLLDLSRPKVRGLVDGPRFPKPVATFGSDRVWARVDVEAYLTDRPLPVRPENALQEKLLDSGALAAMLGVSPAATHRPGAVPPPTARAGNRRLWHVDEIAGWRART